LDPEGNLLNMNPQAEVTFPNGTVSALIDYDLGVLRIFSEPEPDPEDWQQAAELAASVAGGGWDCLEDGIIDVFDIRIVPQVKGLVA